MGRLPIHCERARLWASLAADAEVSELERASLDAHLRECGVCADYAAQLAEIARRVRETPLVEPARPLVVGARRRRRSGRLQLVGSAAAVAAALAFGSLAGTLSSRGAAAAHTQSATAHRLLIQQSLLALMAGSADASHGGGRVIPS